MDLRYPMIFAKDLDRMTAFYRDGLGLRLRPESVKPGWVEFDAGGAGLALHAIPDHIAATIDITVPPAAREDSATKLVFQTADVAAARAHLIAHGAMMFEMRGSGSCDGLDPEGNVFQIMKG
jgi:catechol 2,3-dioxygenase-like lactoylglutathione lyase family enzyme